MPGVRPHLRWILPSSPSSILLTELERSVFRDRLSSGSFKGIIPMQSSKPRRIRIRSRFSRDNDLTLFHGDCLAFLGMIPNNSAKLIVTSPPYNVGKSYEKRLPLDDYLSRQRLVIAECVRVLRPGG